MYIFLIPAFPLAAFFINILFGKRMPKKSSLVSISAILISFVLSVKALLVFISSHHAIHYSVTWIKTGVIIPFGFIVDGLSAVMLIVVTTVSLLVHIYSIGYMHGDSRYHRFYAYLSLFSASMLELILSDNLLGIFIGWEMVGLCSYLLIGFWYEKDSAANAGRKAFITTKIGDFGFYIGIFTLFLVTKSLGIGEISEKVSSLSTGVITISALLIFCGAVGKSAQFPLHVWLPDAMEGPTPVSALIHAATMVAAGVYMVARMYGVFMLSETALNVVAWIGTITAFMAATIALVNNDIKRVLAYSTLSQLGYMMLALGVGGYTAGMFHLTTHAFFKALLFLGAGSVIHGCGTQDIREMGGLSKKMKITALTFFIASFAISGIWPFSGFYSKDEILLAAFYSNKVIYIIGTFVAFLTSFYMFRLCFLTFSGEPRKKLHAHESPATMTLPLLVLAILSIVSGFLLLRHNFFPNLIHREGISHHEPNTIVMILSIIMAVSGIVLAWLVYVKKLINIKYVVDKFKPLYNLLYNKYYFDEIYNVAVIKGTLKISKVMFAFDSVVIDGFFVNGLGILTEFLSKVKNAIDIYIVDGAVNGVGWIARKTGSILRLFQTGLVQNYIMIIAIGISIIIIFKVF